MAPIPGALFGTPLSWKRIESSLPPRCSHKAAILKVQGIQVMVVLGGIANKEWHASTLVITGAESVFPGEPDEPDSMQQPLSSNIKVFEATSTSDEALARREIAACAISDTSVLVSGGIAQNSDSLDLWLGDLSCGTGVLLNLIACHATV
jgi:hypothetical protein